MLPRRALKKSTGPCSTVSTSSTFPPSCTGDRGAKCAGSALLNCALCGSCAWGWATAFCWLLSTLVWQGSLADWALLT